MIDTKRVKSNVIFGDLNFEDYNAFAFGCNLFDRPERSVEVIQIPGRNGDLVLDNGKYNNIDRVYHVQVTGIRNIDALMSRLSSMVGYYQLEDEYEPDVYFTARLKSPPEILQIAGENAHLLVTLDRYPQKWLKSAENSVHPTYLGESTSIDYFHYKDASDGHEYSRSIFRGFFKFVITNPMSNDVYGAVRFYIPADLSRYFYPRGFGMLQLDRDIGSGDDAELLDSAKNGTNYYIFPPNINQEPPDKYNINNNMVFFVRQNCEVINISTKKGIGGDDGDYIDYDLETNVLTCSERLKFENDFVVVQWSAAGAIKPGKNYLYTVFEATGYFDNTFTSVKQQIIDETTLSLRLYEI